MLLILALLQALAGPGDVSVMSFNIRYGTARDGDNAWPNRRAQVIEVIARHQPDILGVQEALEFQLEEIQARLPGYGRTGVGRDDGRAAGEFSAVLYRKDRYEVRDQGTFWFSPEPETPGSTGWGNNITRICSWARMYDRELNQALYVYNLHLDHESAPSRQRSVELLAQRIAAREPADRVIVMGDFNAGEAQEPIRYLLRHVPLIDTFRTIHPDASGVGTYHGFTGRTDGEKIDHILIGSGWSVRSAGIDRSHAAGRFPSDHFPVVAVVRPSSE
jgi:endonuclease/exonuclease/phosphatase family metal-dependent hydrolase